MTKKKTTKKKAKRHPATKDLPDSYVHDPKLHGPAQKVWRRRPPTPPCTRCKARLTVNASQAVICYGSKQGEKPEAYLLCRVCGHQFTLPIEG